MDYTRLLNRGLQTFKKPPHRFLNWYRRWLNNMGNGVRDTFRAILGLGRKGLGRLFGHEPPPHRKRPSGQKAK